jgi:YhcH/YjgK/YiaL family protein
MVIDDLQNADNYKILGEQLAKGLSYLQKTDFTSMAVGKYEIEGDKIFAIISEYNTIDTDSEKMEAHKKHIDIQYWVSGAEKVGHDILKNQPLFKEYDTEKDFLLVGNFPSYFSVMQAGMFAIYFPWDLHMPCIKIDEAAVVKKVVVKVAV